YDLDAHRLLPGRVADKAQKSWVMQGFAAARATSPDGRWVYTLYANPGGYRFVHGLDTVRGVAHCFGLPWTSVYQNAIFDTKLALVGMFGNPYTAGGAEGMSHDGATLVLQNADGIQSPSTFAVVDANRLRLVHEVQLNGVFSYDALSPDGRRLYLIQYTQGRSGDLSH